MKYKYVLWDWNGTVLDDLEASLLAVNDMLDRYGKPRLDVETYYRYVDTPIYKFYEHIFDLNEIPFSLIKAMYCEDYARYEDKAVIAPNALETLSELKKMGVKQYILSAAHIDDLSKGVDRLGISGFFDKLEAATDYEAGSKIERGLRLLKEESIVPSECVMVGDTLHDMETAEALGVDCILYSKGHNDVRVLEKTGRPVCSDFREILKLMKEN